jgi:uncharacterized protein with GYD domain
MATFMFQGCYTSAAMAAMVREPEDRSVIVGRLVEGLGGKMEGFWLSFGEHDFVGVAQLPDSQAAAAFALAAAAGGGVHNFKTVELLTWAEGVKVLKKAGGLQYRPPMNPAK